MTKIEQVHLHLRRHRSITSVQAFARYGVTRLADCVFTLRGRGVHIETELVPHGVTRYARYRMVK
jgi:hypothetical protein